MQDMLKDKVALITGATSGMGKAIAKLFAAEGAKVIIGGRNQTRAQAIVDDIIAAGGEAVTFGPMDVTSKEQIKHTVDATMEKYGRIDILAAFAGGSFYDNPNLTPEEVYRKTMAVNLDGCYDTVFAVVPIMKKQKSGNIIICSSNGAFNPSTHPYEYHIAKGACEALTKNLAFELGPLGIRANCIKPGAIATEFWDELAPEGPERDALFNGISMKEVPLNRMGTAEDIAGAALFFASDLSAYVTGNLMYVGGGMGEIYAHGQSFILGNTPTGDAGATE